MIIKSISPSKLEAYNTCPRCFFLSTQKAEFHQSAALLFGGRGHKAIEKYHKHGLTEFDKDLQIYLDEYMAEYNDDFDLCEEFWSLPLFDTGIVLKLKMDLIKDNILIDHKFVSRPYSQQIVDKQKQVSAYSWAWSQKYTEPENHIRFNMFITNPKPDEKLLQKIDTRRTPDDHEEWKEWTMKILEGIENDQFEPKQAPWHNYKECPLYVEKDED